MNNIQSLIDFHKEAKQEAEYLLSEYHQIDLEKINPAEKEYFKERIKELETEIHYRNSFINQLEDIQ
jgi:pyruvate-formate lyase-activating enzyme